MGSGSDPGFIRLLRLTREVHESGSGLLFAKFLHIFMFWVRDFHFWTGLWLWSGLGKVRLFFNAVQVGDCNWCFVRCIGDWDYGMGFCSDWYF